MHEGIMVKTGGCHSVKVNKKGEGVVNPGDGENEFIGQCTINEGDIFVKARKFSTAGTGAGPGPGSVKPTRVNDRLNNINLLGV